MNGSWPLKSATIGKQNTIYVYQGLRFCEPFFVDIRLIFSMGYKKVLDKRLQGEPSGGKVRDRSSLFLYAVPEGGGRLFNCHGQHRQHFAGCAGETDHQHDF